MERWQRVDREAVVDAIAEVQTGSQGYYDDVPTEPIEITSAKVVE